MRRVFLHGGRDTSSTILLLKMVPLLPLEKARVESRFTRRGAFRLPWRNSQPNVAGVQRTPLRQNCSYIRTGEDKQTPRLPRRGELCSPVL